MPQQLIYTSAQRGLVAGRSGHCTVARSAAMREALMLQLEKLSYYQHLSLSGGQERHIYSCRLLDIRGSRFHVLSRIQDAGLDFTNRTNFLAHHLVFTPEEIRQFPSPPVILRSWSGWVKSWNQEPQMLENEDWSGLLNISGTVSVPATTWQQVTGDAVNGYGLLEARSGMAFRVDNFSEDQILALFAESLELLELRDPRHDFRVTGWQYTFTTSMQEQDNPADFRWRCLHSDNPVSNRSAGPDCRPLSDVRAQKVTNEEKIFAHSGKQPPRFVTQPQNTRVSEGEPARFRVMAEGVPSPSYQWYSVDQAGNGQIIPNGTTAELVIRMGTIPNLGWTSVIRRSRAHAKATIAHFASSDRNMWSNKSGTLKFITPHSKVYLPQFLAHRYSPEAQSFSHIHPAAAVLPVLFVNKHGESLCCCGRVPASAPCQARIWHDSSVAVVPRCDFTAKSWDYHPTIRSGNLGRKWNWHFWANTRMRKWPLAPVIRSARLKCNGAN